MSSQKMQAAVVTAFGKPLELQEWDVPTPMHLNPYCYPFGRNV